MLSNYSWVWVVLEYGCRPGVTSLEKTDVPFSNRYHLQIASWWGVGFCVRFPFSVLGFIWLDLVWVSVWHHRVCQSICVQSCSVPSSIFIPDINICNAYTRPVLGAICFYGVPFLHEMFLKHKTTRITTITATTATQLSWLWWHMPLIPTLKTQRQADLFRKQTNNLKCIFFFFTDLDTL